MRENAGKKLSQRTVKRNFNTVGLILILYVLLVMFVPYAFHFYLIESSSPILNDDILYYGIYYLFIVFGTIIPFFILRKFSKIKLKRIVRKAKATFIDLFVQANVFYTICIGCTYVSNMIFNYFGLEGKLLSAIGLNFESANNLLYIFMLVFASPIIEEYAFRGVLLSSLSRYSKTFALYATSIIFALAHNNFAEMIPAFAMGVTLGKTALRYKSIQPTIIIHIFFNASIFGMSILPVGAIKYMAYVLVAIIIIALVLIVSGRYEKINIQKSKSTGIANRIFYSRFSVVLAMLLMIAYTCLFTFTIK